MKTFGKLRERIREKYKTQKVFALAISMDISTLNAKLNGLRDWTLSEIESACRLLDIRMDEVKDYFFYD